MALTSNESGLVFDDGQSVDPLGDEERLEQSQARKNYAKVGSARPSSLMYTYGPGSVMDMPHFTVMPMGLQDWQRIYDRRAGGVPTVHAPRLLDAVRMILGNQVAELRPFPWQPTTKAGGDEGRDLGVPARVFPQWMRCTGCDKLAPISQFEYVNDRRGRPDQAEFRHKGCRGRNGGKGGSKPRDMPCVPARYLIACEDGHLDEFPYDWWVHKGQPCKVAQIPELRMRENASGRGSGAVIECLSCGMKRAMQEAQGEQGRTKLPACRGRMPHLDSFDHDGQGCAKEPRIMVLGASNMWFPVVQGIVDMPLVDKGDAGRAVLDKIRVALGPFAGILDQEPTAENAAKIAMMLAMNPTAPQELKGLSEDCIAEYMALAQQPVESEEERKRRRDAWEPADLLVPEWRYLQNDSFHERTRDEESGFTVSPREVPDELRWSGVSRVLAVDSLRKVNALVGFTRVDDYNNTEGADRLVALTRDPRPTWVPVTEDRGEGVYIQLDEDAVTAWEEKVEASALWAKHRASFVRYYESHLSPTAKRLADPTVRLPPPRYWLVHTLAHALIRRMAVSAGYGIPSLSERLYAWRADADKGREAASGLLIMTTASDSEGTLGGLVALSDPERLRGVFGDALRDMTRCSSDPVCAGRIPEDPEEFLHGASCHCCTMLSETSCERANRFLDRRFLVPLNGECEGEPFSELAFFRDADV